MSKKSGVFVYSDSRFNNGQYFLHLQYKIKSKGKTQFWASSGLGVDETHSDVGPAQDLIYSKLHFDFFTWDWGPSTSATKHWNSILLNFRVGGDGERMGEIVRSEWMVDPSNPNQMVRRNSARNATTNVNPSSQYFRATVFADRIRRVITAMVKYWPADSTVQITRHRSSDCTPNGCRIFSLKH